MVRRGLCISVAALFVTLSAPAAEKSKELVVVLSFSPQEGVESVSPEVTADVLDRPVVLRVEDGRPAEARNRLGQGTDDDDEYFPIRAAGEVLPYVRETVTRIARDWRVKVEQNGERVLTLKLLRFGVEERNKAVGSTYEAEVELSYSLHDADGRELFDGKAYGSATRYGRARRADNCNEVLSDALKGAFADVLNSSGLQRAWASGRPPESESTPGSIEERLKRLDDLLSKGLITKEEYEAKRAEILSEL